MALVLYYSCNYLVCKDTCQDVREPPSSAVRGRTAGLEQGGLKPRARSWKDALGRGPWQEHAWDHRQGITEFGIKGKGESVVIGRAVRSEGPALPRVGGHQAGCPVLGASSILLLLGCSQQPQASHIPFVYHYWGERGKCLEVLTEGQEPSSEFYCVVFRKPLHSSVS